MVIQLKGLRWWSLKYPNIIHNTLIVTVYSEENTRKKNIGTSSRIGVGVDTIWPVKCAKVCCTLMRLLAEAFAHWCNMFPLSYAQNFQLMRYSVPLTTKIFISIFAAHYNYVFIKLFSNELRLKRKDNTIDFILIQIMFHGKLQSCYLEGVKISYIVKC